MSNHFLLIDTSESGYSAINLNSAQLISCREDENDGVTNVYIETSHAIFTLPTQFDDPDEAPFLIREIISLLHENLGIGALTTLSECEKRAKKLYQEHKANMAIVPPGLG